MKRKASQTQQLIEAIMQKYQTKDINEAWRIYRQKYEQDIELDPSKFQSKPLRHLREDTEAN